MKRLILLIFIPCFLGAHSAQKKELRTDDQIRTGIVEESGRDSCLVAYLEKKDSLSFSLVLENLTQDTMIMRATFEDYRFYPEGAPQGFIAHTYFNKRMGVIPWDEPQIYYPVSETDSLSELRGIGPIAWIFPRSKAKLHFPLNQFTYIPDDTKDEIGVQFFVRYSYIMHNRDIRLVDATTNYIPLIEPKK
jgi:hypothetical protein